MGKDAAVGARRSLLVLRAKLPRSPVRLLALLARGDLGPSTDRGGWSPGWVSDGRLVLVGWLMADYSMYGPGGSRVSSRVSSDAHWPASPAGGTRGQQSGQAKVDNGWRARPSKA